MKTIVCAYDSKGKEKVKDFMKCFRRESNKPYLRLDDQFPSRNMIATGSVAVVVLDWCAGNSRVCLTFAIVRTLKSKASPLPNHVGPRFGLFPATPERASQCRVCPFQVLKPTHDGYISPIYLPGVL